MSPPQGTACPGCEAPAGILIGDQALCLNFDCHVFMWNMLQTLEELAADIKVIDLSFREDS